MSFLDDSLNVDVAKKLGDLFSDSGTGTQTADDERGGSWIDFDDLFGGDDDADAERAENELFGWSSDESDGLGDVDGEPTAVDYDEGVAAWASRQTTDSATQTALDCGYEIRNIVLCKSIQFTRAQFDYDRDVALLEASMAKSAAARQDNLAYAERISQYIVPDGLEVDESLGEITNRNQYELEFRNDSQRVIYRLKVYETKDAFMEALQTEGTIVVYSGHSRYGRGPCFGPTDAPGENWEHGDDPLRDGLFRMGYPIIAVHTSEIATHGYSFYPVSTADFPDGKVPAMLLHPDVPAGQVRRTKLPAGIRGKALIEYNNGDSGGFPDHQDVFCVPHHGMEAILLWAGWCDTTSDPFELDKVELRCRCLCMFGCSTATHYREIVQEYKGFRQTENERYSYFTSAPTTAYLMKFWIEGLLNYDRDNANQGWATVLEHAKAYANKRLAARGSTFRVV